MKMTQYKALCDHSPGKDTDDKFVKFERKEHNGRVGSSIYFCICSFNKYSWDAYHVLGTLLASRTLKADKELSLEQNLLNGEPVWCSQMPMIAIKINRGPSHVRMALGHFKPLKVQVIRLSKIILVSSLKLGVISLDFLKTK